MMKYRNLGFLHKLYTSCRHLTAKLLSFNFSISMLWNSGWKGYSASSVIKHVTQKNFIYLVFQSVILFTNYIFTFSETSYSCLNFSRFLVFFQQFGRLLQHCYLEIDVLPQFRLLKTVCKYLESFWENVNSRSKARVTSAFTKHERKQSTCLTRCIADE